MTDLSLVHVRVPTYKRGEALARCLRSVQAQTWPHWVCDVHDDDPEGSARAVVEAMDDPRVRFIHNRPQRFAAGNIDGCFSKDNPHGADWFCVLEDDNLLLPEFMATNIADARAHGVQVVMRAQVVELASGTPKATITDWAVQRNSFQEGVYPAALFRMAVFGNHAASNGGLFWSARAKTDFQIVSGKDPSLHEFMRTFVIEDDVFVGLRPLAVWADNGADSLREQGRKGAGRGKKLRLIKSQQLIRQAVWRGANAELRRAVLSSPAFGPDPRARALRLTEALIPAGPWWRLPAKTLFRAVGRAAVAALTAAPEPGLREFIAARQSVIRAAAN
jgi:glycosyltransferase involved in cell wall biosynthesis